jgi:ABC-2 type transport system permease protein
VEKILLIVQREYITRVRKKSFIIMSILGPLLIAAIYIIPAWLAISGSDEKLIQVVDESGYFAGKMKDTDKIKFTYSQSPFSEVKENAQKDKSYDAWLHIPRFDLQNPQGISLYSAKSLAMGVQHSVESALEREIEKIKLQQSGIDEQVLKSLKTNISIKSVTFDEGKEKDSNSMAASAIGMASGLVMYFFIFLYGAQVMRGVIEEKTNRIVEIMISSVKPFQLMMGKILGLAAVGFTQFMIWLVLGYGVAAGTSLFFDMKQTAPANMPMAQNAMTGLDAQQAAEVSNTASGDAVSQFFESLGSFNIPLILFCFVFYFIFGYLLYAALFGAIGSAVDSETDTQQFMLPVTVPLILSIVMMGPVISEPDGNIAFWMSIIPLTSPTIMMIRLPFIGFGWELLLSMVLLVLGFLGATWMAGRIYRVGILMYGKKVTFKEIGKWLFYKG